MRGQQGFSIVELLVGILVSTVVFLAILSAYSQGNNFKEHVRGTVRIQANVRLAMDRLERDFRMIGFAVPDGPEIGGTAFWAPAIFHADRTEIGFRADLDAGAAEIVCTPHASNADCPLHKLRLDSIRYYEALNCAAPDGAPGGTRLIATARDRSWQSLTCSGFSASDGSIWVGSVEDFMFVGGMSQVSTIEQVYYRFVPRAQSPYGTLLRHVRYDNVPNDVFPPTGASWESLANRVTDFWLEYRDRTGATLPTPLSVADRDAVTTIVLFVEGYDRVGPDGHPQLIRSRSEILVRDPL